LEKSKLVTSKNVLNDSVDKNIRKFMSNIWESIMTDYKTIKHKRKMDKLNNSETVLRVRSIALEQIMQIHKKSLQQDTVPFKLAKKSVHSQIQGILLKQFVSAAVLVDVSGRILYIHGHAGEFLELLPGNSEVYHIHKMVKSEIRGDLKRALSRSYMQQRVVFINGLAFANNKQEEKTINLSVRPLIGRNSKIQFLIIFDNATNYSEEFNQLGKCIDFDLDAKTLISEGVSFYNEFSQSAEELRLIHEKVFRGKQELSRLNLEISESSKQLEINKKFPEQLRSDIVKIKAQLTELKKELKNVGNDLLESNLELQSIHKKIENVDEELLEKNEQLFNKNIELEIIKDKHQSSELGHQGKAIWKKDLDRLETFLSDAYKIDLDLSSFFEEQDQDVFSEVDSLTTAMHTDLDNKNEKDKIIASVDEVQYEPGQVQEKKDGVKSPKVFNLLEEQNLAVEKKWLPRSSDLEEAPVVSKDLLLKVHRQEKKYLITSSKASSLSAKLDKVLHGDRHNGDEGYLVRSLYFDTVNDRDYFEKEDGLFCRQKIRFRIYSTEDKFVKLEKKEKEGEFQCKRSLKMPREAVTEFINGNFERLLSYEEKFAEELYLDMTTSCYVPKCIVEYNRKAFIVPENDIRITIDSNISATESCFDIFSNDLYCYPVSHPDDVTLEVKFNGFLLTYVKDLLDSCKKTQLSNSKYYMARSVGQGKAKLF
jgi:hypothetical protein